MSVRYAYGHSSAAASDMRTMASADTGHSPCSNIPVSAAAKPSNIIYDDTPIHVYMKRIHARLLEHGCLSFKDLFDRGMPTVASGIVRKVFQQTVRGRVADNLDIRLPLQLLDDLVHQLPVARGNRARDGHVPGRPRDVPP